jgi:hypothetical protein
MFPLESWLRFEGASEYQQIVIRHASAVVTRSKRL